MSKKSKRGAGSLVKRGGVFYLRYYDGSKTATGAPRQVWHSLKQSDRKLAEESAATFREWLAHKGERVRLEEALQATAGREDAAHDALRDKLTVAGAWDKFVAAKNRKQCGALTLLDYSQRWAKFATWWPTYAAGRPALEQVTPADTQAFASQLDGDRLSANRYNKIIQTCRYVFNTLAPQCAGMGNPFGATAGAGISNRPQVTLGRRELSEGELRAVCSAAVGELRTLLAIGIFTGLRLHDAACLRWEAVSLPLARLTVQPHKTRTRGGKVLVIPLHDALAAILADTPLAARRDYVLPETAAAYLHDRTTVSHHLQRVFRAADIVTTRDTKTAHRQCEVGFHSLRHSFVSLSARAGTPLAVVQELCGHGSPAIQRAYLHMGETATRAAVGALPNVMLAAAPLALADPHAAARAEAVALIATASDRHLQAALAALKSA